MKARSRVGILAVFTICGCGAPPVTTALRPDPSMPDPTWAFHVVPFPKHVEPRTGAFLVGENTPIQLSDGGNADLRALGAYAVEMLAAATGLPLSLAEATEEAGSDGAILLSLSPSDTVPGPERYRLDVSDGSIQIAAADPAGLFYGLQTLRQLMPAGTRQARSGRIRAVAVRAVTIDDEPRFSYRGMHLDVGRHFFPVEFVKKYIDLLATYKMNTFHWHLTEDQGWRIAIEQYPRLTEVGAFRNETILEKNFDPYVGDATPHGGFYTQEQIREVVAYARRRFVTVIPEIEMPGHSTAALAAYPELGCTDAAVEVATVWGVHENIYCPEEITFSFLEAVLREVMELFPSTYIHIGGDEVPKRQWQESDVARAVMQREELADESELQSYFIRRIEQFLSSHGRRLIGWDEILEGGLAPGATVMSWRGTAGGIAAARQGHDVVMTPTSHVYFDYYQGDPRYEPLAIGGYTPLDRVYSFEPVPDELTAEEAKHILGAQGNVWTEYIKTPQHVEYMALPRMLALAEVVWSPRQRRDWDFFLHRLPSHFGLLDGLDVNYRVPHVEGLEQDRLTLADHVEVSLNTPVAGVQIRYTLDGSDPTQASAPYETPLLLHVDAEGVTVTARAFLPWGAVSPSRAARFRRTRLMPAQAMDKRQLERGLRYRYYELHTSTVDGITGGQPERWGVTPAVGLVPVAGENRFGVDLKGYVDVPMDGVYTFYLTSDDGSRLRIGDRVVIDHDGLHGATERSGQIALAAGFHPLSIQYFQAGGGRALSLTVSLGDERERQELTGWLHHAR
jgi:hexosaminidase